MALLDTGATCPPISTWLVEAHGIPFEVREAPLPISTFDGAALPDAGKAYTHVLRLRHNEHVTPLAFEIAPLEPSSDIILPHWWMVEHPPIGLTEGSGSGRDIGFTSPRCATRCTEHALTTFPIQ